MVRSTKQNEIRATVTALPSERKTIKSPMIEDNEAQTVTHFQILPRIGFMILKRMC